MLQTSFYAIMGILYPERLEEMIGYLEGATGFALSAGPIFGTLLFNLGGKTFGFSLVFAVQALIYFLVLFIVYKVIEPKADDDVAVSDLTP